MPKFILLIFAVVLAGCASHYDIDMEYSGARASVVLQCPVDVKFFDKRKKKTAYGKTVSSSEAEEWMLAAMRQWGTISVSAVEENTLDIKLLLHRAYIHHAATSQSAIVALTAIVDGKEEYYRGRSTDVLWWGAEWEFAGEFNAALDDLKPKLIADVVSACEARQPSTLASSESGPQKK